MKTQTLYNCPTELRPPPPLAFCRKTHYFGGKVQNEKQVLGLSDVAPLTPSVPSPGMEFFTDDATRSPHFRPLRAAFQRIVRTAEEKYPIALEILLAVAPSWDPAIPKSHSVPFPEIGASYSIGHFPKFKISFSQSGMPMTVAHISYTASPSAVLMLCFGGRVFFLKVLFRPHH